MNQKGNIYIIAENILYGSAVTNRLLAYARGFKEYGVSSEILALRGYAPLDYKQEEGFRMRGCFAIKCGHKLFRLLASYIYVLYFTIFRLKKTDVVILYGCLEYIQLFLIFGRCKVYQERTENPEVVSSRLLSLPKYLKLCRNLDGMFVISRPLKRYFTNAGVEENKIHIINMIVDPSRFTNVPVDTSQGKYIAYCGNIWDDTKDGVSELLKSFAKYHHEYPDRKLYIAGPIKSQRQKEIYEQFANVNGIGSSVVFMGLVSPNEMPKLLANAEMLMLTRPNNKQAEFGFPTKLGEYLLTKRPVVVSRVGDIDAFLTDGDNALLAEADNVDDIVTKMLWVSKNPIEASELGAKGHDCAMDNFNNIIEAGKILQAIGYNIN